MYYSLKKLKYTYIVTVPVTLLSNFIYIFFSHLVSTCFVDKVVLTKYFHFLMVTFFLYSSDIIVFAELALLWYICSFLCDFENIRFWPFITSNYIKSMQTNLFVVLDEEHKESLQILVDHTAKFFEVTW